MQEATKIPAEVDVLVVGGGVNGAGIARDLAGRALSVLLAEQHDLAAHTSSASTKLIHGGLRYLEHYEFSLVRKALAEREVLLRSAPHIMAPLRFVMPHDPAMRPVWMIRAGLFLYDHLARREWLPGSRAVDLARHPAGAALKPQFRRGFVYSDGRVDDARLVVLCALDARERGACVLTRWRCEHARVEAGRWEVELRSADGATRSVRARALVNATGPWAASFLHQQLGTPRAQALRLVKGSHIVVPRLFEHDHAYIFQNADHRIIFAIPYEGEFTLIGTTDVECHGDPGDVRADAQEVAYLCEQASRYLARAVQPSAVVWSYCGVRPLLDDESGDPSELTRDYQLELTAAPAPLLSVWGGKITTFRRLAEEAADQLCSALQVRATGWTHGALLPGGDLSAWIAPSGRPDTDIARFEHTLQLRHPDLPPALCHRWSRSYGSLVQHLLDDPAGLGPEVAPGLHEAELRYLCRREWARAVNDVLWRRSKLGLHYNAEQRATVARWLDEHAEASGATVRLAAK
ncbi:MAG: glycerol-3-phosphate dehydrogenase [Burkholderiaceae bacterium]|nr:MAG: glycerol-3-phosphate dehydrogenase [Burkholderiaceae bacterium]